MIALHSNVDRLPDSIKSDAQALINLLSDVPLSTDHNNLSAFSTQVNKLTPHISPIKPATYQANLEDNYSLNNSRSLASELSKINTSTAS